MTDNRNDKNLEYVSCNYCGRDSTSLRYTVNGFKIVECNHCRLIYVNPRLKPLELEKQYNEEYYQNKAQESYNQKFFSDYIGERDVRTQEFKLKLEEIVKILGDRRGRLLDIGCAAGFFLDAARERKFDVQGVEISKFSSQFAREKLGLKVFSGSLHEALYADESFDLITSWDCIEHVPDPSGFLAETRRILKNDGMAVIETMNMDSFCSIVYRENFKPVVPEAHIYYFTVSSFLRMLNKAGFNTIHISFPFFNSRWFDLDEINRLFKDLKDYSDGKEVLTKSPAFWGNLMTFFVVKDGKP